MCLASFCYFFGLANILTLHSLSISKLSELGVRWGRVREGNQREALTYCTEQAGSHNSQKEKQYNHCFCSLTIFLDLFSSSCVGIFLRDVIYVLRTGQEVRASNVCSSVTVPLNSQRVHSKRVKGRLSKAARSNRNLLSTEMRTGRLAASNKSVGH